MRARLVALVVVLLPLLLAACEGSTSRASAPPRVSTSDTGTSTPSRHEPTPAPSPGSADVGCAASRYFMGIQPTRVGDLLVAAESSNFYGSGGVQLPDSAPLAPYKVPGRYYSSLVSQGGLATASGAGHYPVGYVLAVCNNSATQARTIDGVYVRIDHLTPYAGHLNEFACGERAYTRSSVPGASGCGGAYDQHLQSVFPSQTAVGTIMTATDVGNDSNYSDINGYPPARLGPLPETLGPHQGIVFRIEPVVPGASATYVFSFGLGIDGAGPVFGPTSYPVLIAPVAREWTGDACQASAMQQLIPPATTNSPTFYVCPPQA